jgi:hypothetical protein
MDTVEFTFTFLTAKTRHEIIKTKFEEVVMRLDSLAVWLTGWLADMGIKKFKMSAYNLWYNGQCTNYTIQILPSSLVFH